MSLDKERVVSALPNYEVGEELGRGGWAVVIHARHRILEREVAVKHLPVAFGADPMVRSRFVAEAQLVAKLDHPHIVPVYDFVEHDGTYLIVMEYLAGGSLWDKFLDHGVCFDEACAYILVACSALEHAHEMGTLHRDIKPENFLLDDRPGVIKLSDFGIAKALGAAAAQFTRAGQVVGTPAYMAPEQILAKPVSPATDVYACGTMLYELLSGELPFPEGDSPLSRLGVKVSEKPIPISVVQPAIPKQVAEVVMRSLETDPGDRYRTAREFGEALAEAATAAFGPGWLRRTGIRLDGAGHLFGITERPASTPGPTAGSFDPIRATVTHHRMGDLIAEAKQSMATGEAAPAERSPSTGSESPPSESTGPPPGWYDDPHRRFEQRYWDGSQWTPHVAVGGVAQVDPTSG